MTVELKAKSQVTIPMALVKSLSLKQGDLFDIFVEDGKIVLVPVAVYPKAYVEKLEREVRNPSGQSQPFHDVDELIASLEEN